MLLLYLTTFLLLSLEMTIHPTPLVKRIYQTGKGWVWWRFLSVQRRVWVCRLKPILSTRQVGFILPIQWPIMPVNLTTHCPLLIELIGLIELGSHGQFIVLLGSFPTYIWFWVKLKIYVVGGIGMWVELENFCWLSWNLSWIETFVTIELVDDD